MKLVLTAILFVSSVSAFAKGDARPCLERHMELVPTGSGELIVGSADDGSVCQVDSYYNKHSGSVSVMVVTNEKHMSATFGTNYQFRKVKCSVTESGLVLDSKRKDDEQYSSSVRHVLKVESRDDGKIRIELSKPGTFSSKRNHCNI